MTQSAKPIVKWAGGKTGLLPVLRALYPQKGENLTTYVEPFLGGGAVFFDVIRFYSFQRIILNDSNRDLINLYCMVRDESEKLIVQLSSYQETYQASNEEQKKEQFYACRQAYNDHLGDETVDQAARFIFLNKTCYNGLFRVNSRGHFNVPAGRYAKPLICDDEGLRAASAALQKATLQTGSFVSCEEACGAGSFVYLDPPYRPITATAAFTAYQNGGFNDDDQRELASFVRRIAARGAQFVLSNSDPTVTKSDDDFFDVLYGGFSIERVMAPRFISSKGTGRKAIRELVIHNRGASR